MTILGAVLLPQVAPEQLSAIVKGADEAGLAELWLWEDCFFQGGIATAAAALASTVELRIGIGVLPVPMRNVALTAMELAALYRLFPGRVEVGVGHGVQTWMAQIGAAVDSPMTLLGEYLPALRRLLSGERVSTAGRYVQLDQVGLEWPPVSAVRISCAAVGPRSLRLAGELADGTVLTGGTSPAGVRAARELIEQGRTAGGRRDEHRITVYVPAATGPGAADRLAAEQRRAGFDPADTGVAGDAQAFADAVRRWADAGASAVIFQPTVDEPDLTGFLRFIGGEVANLVG